MTLTRREGLRCAPIRWTAHRYDRGDGDAREVLTEGQLEALASRREEFGADAIERGQREWAEIFAALDAERTAGTDPADPRVQELVRRGGELVAQFTGGDTEIRASLQRMYEEEGPERASRGTVDPELWAYYQIACAATAGS